MRHHPKAAIVSYGTPTLQSSESPHKVIYSRAGTPAAGRHLAVPPSGNTNQGSIALRAIHSVLSLARIGSWAQLKNMPPPDVTSMAYVIFLVSLPAASVGDI
jgi:serine/arginine repetitive matrix protein 2